MKIIWTNKIGFAGITKEPYKIEINGKRYRGGVIWWKDINKDFNLNLNENSTRKDLKEQLKQSNLDEEVELEVWEMDIT